MFPCLALGVETVATPPKCFGKHARYHHVTVFQPCAQCHQLRVRLEIQKRLRPARREEKGREENRRKDKGREDKGREEKLREGKGREIMGKEGKRREEK